MAKKTTKKAGAKRKKPQKTPQTLGEGDTSTSTSTTQISDEQKAQMWVLREEGRSLRQIASEVGCSTRSVQREFHTDPARHATLVRVQKEERAAIWQQSENRSLKLLVKMLEEDQTQLWTPTGRPKKLTGKRQEEIFTRIDTIRKMIGPIRMAADSSTKMSQLLTGGATEIVGSSSDGVGLGVDPSKMTDEEAIELAIAHGLVDELPQALRERVEKMRAEGKIA